MPSGRPASSCLLSAFLLEMPASSARAMEAQPWESRAPPFRGPVWITANAYGHLLSRYRFFILRGLALGLMNPGAAREARGTWPAGGVPEREHAAWKPS